MTIIWKNKPANYDTRNVDRVWIDKQQLRYTTTFDAYVFRASAREVEAILDDATYATQRSEGGAL